MSSSTVASFTEEAVSALSEGASHQLFHVCVYVSMPSETLAQDIARDQEDDAYYFSPWSSWICVMAVVVIIGCGIDQWIQKWWRNRHHGKV